MARKFATSHQQDYCLRAPIRRPTRKPLERSWQKRYDRQTPSAAELSFWLIGPPPLRLRLKVRAESRPPAPVFLEPSERTIHHLNCIRDGGGRFAKSSNPVDVGFAAKPRQLPFRVVAMPLLSFSNRHLLADTT